MQELEFFGKTRGKITDSTADVVVKVFCQDAKKNITATRFTFTERAFKKLTQTGYVMAAVLSNRVYFKEASGQDGFKITQTKETGRVVFPQKILHEMFTTEAQNFDLRYDKQRDLYYIEKSDLDFFGKKKRW